jgi:hypothetical protein
VWVCLGATAIAVSVIITAAELLAGGERANRKGLRGWSWYCMTKMVQVGDVRYVYRMLLCDVTSVLQCSVTSNYDCSSVPREMQGGSTPTGRDSGAGAGTA